MILNSNWCTRASDERRTLALVVTCVILQCPLWWQGPWNTWQAQAESKSTGATFLTHLYNNQQRMKHKGQYKAALSPSFLLLIWAGWGPGLLLGTCFSCLLPSLYQVFGLIWTVGAGSQNAPILWWLSLFFLHDDTVQPGFKFSARHSNMH